MSIVKVPNDNLKQRQCGFKPTYFEIGYGSTPYTAGCPICDKYTGTYRNIGGSPQNIVDFWNTIASMREIKPLMYQCNGQVVPYVKLREHILSQANSEVYILFQNGRIKEEDLKRFLLQGVDY